MEVSNEMSLEELVKFCTTLNLDNTKPGTVTIIVWTKAEFLKKKNPSSCSKRFRCTLQIANYFSPKSPFSLLKCLERDLDVLICFFRIHRLPEDLFLISQASSRL